LPDRPRRYKCLGREMGASTSELERHRRPEEASLAGAHRQICTNLGTAVAHHDFIAVQLRLHTLRSKSYQESEPFPNCFSNDCRTNPITYGRSSSEDRPTSTSPLPQRPIPETFLQMPLGSSISWNATFKESLSRFACGTTSTKLVSALYAT